MTIVSISTSNFVHDIYPLCVRVSEVSYTIFCGIKILLYYILKCRQHGNAIELWCIIRYFRYIKGTFWNVGNVQYIKRLWVVALFFEYCVFLEH